MTITQQWRRSLALVVGVGATAAVLTLTSAGSAIAQNARPLMTLIMNDSANPVPVRSVGSTLTHLGRPVADIVQLRWWESADCFKQLDVTGLAAADCYTPPAGRALLVTDVEWQAFTGAGNSVELYIYNQGIVFAHNATGGSNGVAAIHQHLQSGFVFDPGLRVQPGGFLVLRGYLVPTV